MLDHLLTIVPPWLIILLVVFGVVLTTVAYLIFLERKIASWVQDRIGPNRVGPWGLLQCMADGLKMFVKEDYRPSNVDKILFSVAPCLMMSVIIGALAVIPWGGIVQGTRTIAMERGQGPILRPGEVLPTGSEGHWFVAGEPLLRAAQAAIPAGSQVVGAPLIGDGVAEVTYRFPFQIADVNVGVLYIVALLSLAIYGVVIGGWASNSKFSFIGGMRAAAQMISYEVPLGLSLLTVIVMFGTLNLGDIIAGQAHYWHGIIPAWNIFTQPLAFLMFLVCIHAEANRAPFDLAECEQELVGGYHTEYSSMRFGLFFLGEYTGMMVTSAVLVALFLGGWHLPWVPGFTGEVDPTNPAVTSSLTIAVLRSLVYFVKVLVVISVFMWVRWSLPRFRFDQLMHLAWRAMIPISLVLFLATAVVLFVLRSGTVRDGESIQAMMLSGREAVALLVVNGGLLVLFLVASRLLPAPPPTNRRLTIPGSRFSTSALPSPANRRKRG